MGLKTYTVRVESISYLDCEIEARDEDHAWEIARDTDGGDFIEDGVGSWDIIRVEEVETEAQKIKAQIASLRKLIRYTEWRSEAYRAKVQIEELQAQLKTLKVSL